MGKTKRFAVFDIDGTLYRNNLTWDFFSQLVQDGLIHKHAVRDLERLYEAHSSRAGDNAYKAYDSQIIDLLYANAGHIKDMDKYWAIGEELAERNSTRLYRYTRELLQELQAQQYHLIAITNGIGAVARPFAKQLGFTTIIANDEVIDPSSKKIIDWAISTEPRVKAAVLEELIDKYALDVAGSYGVGDTLSDASMLWLVEHPIVFNPERLLYDVAMQNSWPIVLERKNVIYRLGGSSSSDESRIAHSVV